MSMFDYLRCDYPLPARRLAQTLVYQTKDFDNIMEEIHIRADGMVMGQVYDHEDRSDPDATGLARLAGSMTRVNIRPVHLHDFTGEITFYSDYGRRGSNGFADGWLEFKARIEQGRLVHVELLEDRVPADVLAEESAQQLGAQTPLPGSAGTQMGGQKRL